MLVVLTVITVITGALLGYVNNITAEPIAQSKKQKQNMLNLIKHSVSYLTLTVKLRNCYLKVNCEVIA